MSQSTQLTPEQLVGLITECNEHIKKMESLITFYSRELADKDQVLYNYVSKSILKV
jgi:hypothetical protein